MTRQQQERFEQMVSELAQERNIPRPYAVQILVRQGTTPENC